MCVSYLYLDVSIDGILDIQPFPHYRGVVPPLHVSKLSVDACVGHDLLDTVRNRLVSRFPGAPFRKFAFGERGLVLGGHLDGRDLVLMAVLLLVDHGGRTATGLLGGGRWALRTVTVYGRNPHLDGRAHRIHIERRLAADCSTVV